MGHEPAEPIRLRQAVAADVDAIAFYRRAGFEPRSLSLEMTV
jgi:hypothetical protein